MKSFKLLIFILSTLLVSSCMEVYNERYLLKDHYVEFEEATSSNKAVGKDYVISKKIVKPNSGTISIQVNLVGPQLSTDQLVKYRIDEQQTTATQGKDYQIENIGYVVFKAFTNIAHIEITPANGGTGKTLLVLQLESNNPIQSSKNYEKIAIRCEYP